MKYILSIYLLFSSAAALAQLDSVISYTAVVEVPNSSKDALFIRARQWFNETFKSAKDVIQISDKETGELAGKGIMKVRVKYKYMGERNDLYYSDFTCNVWVKDNKYKYEVGHFSLTHDRGEYKLGLLTSSEKCPEKWPMVSQKNMDKMYASAKVGVQAEASALIESLKKAMSGSNSKSDF